MGSLTPELRAWIVVGLAGVVTVVDGEGSPRLARIWGARVLEGTDVIEARVQRACAGPLIEALSEPRRGALNLIEVRTYRSRTFKGRCTLLPDGIDVPFVDPAIAEVGRAFHSVGLPADVAQRMLMHATEPHAMIVLHLAVESVFDQSPKPGAGARL